MIKDVTCVVWLRSVLGQIERREIDQFRESEDVLIPLFEMRNRLFNVLWEDVGQEEVCGGENCQESCKRCREQVVSGKGS